MNKESLTIVFSTRKDNPLFVYHLKQTCGVDDVEILQYINDGKYSLTEIYNKALREAKNDIIVFSHDDIIFEPDNWGIKIMNYFKNSDFGIMGKAGTTCITESGRWWDEPHLMVGQVWHQQEDPLTYQTNKWECRYSGNFGEQIIQTILVDGLFFAVHRDRIQKAFDESIKGFHFYDIDFSLANHFEGVKVGVIFDITITHKSIGMVNKEWENNRIQFVSKWKKYLPCNMKPQIMYEEMDIPIVNQPKLAIIIQAKDDVDSFINCMESILGKTRYQNYKMYISYNGFQDDNQNKIREYTRQKNNVIFVESQYANAARIKNDIVKSHIDPDTELILFCHSDIRLLNDAISRCIQIYLDNKNEIGTIGIRLHANDNTISHAGFIIFVDKNNQIGITHKGVKSYYAYNPGVERDILGSSGAFLMVHKNLFISVGGFSEHYKAFYEDVEFNLKSIIAGKINYFIGDAVAYLSKALQGTHHDTERVSIQYEDFQRIISFIQQNTNNPKILDYFTFI
ncbi:MAG: hypothetical protein FJ241_10470 [Nitrospira sp.]|nr:hypothetical protein [Nitrospira sp.]